MNFACGSRVLSLQLEIVGSGIEAEKLRRRVACALKGLGCPAQISVVRELARALDLGVRRSPALLINGELAVEGLLSTEQLEALLRRYPAEIRAAK